MTGLSDITISVITCTLNSENYLEDNLESVWSAHKTPFEQIIIDGYSTDNTLNIVKKYQKKGYNIRVIQTAPRGISDAFNKGITASTGNIIHILNSDDYIINKDIFSLVDQEFQGGVQWLYGRITIVDSEKNTISNHNRYGKVIAWFHFFLCPYPHPSTFIAKEIFDTYGLFDENMKYNMDWDYWIRIKEIEPKKINTFFCAFRIHPDSISAKNTFSRENLQEKIYMLKKYIKGPWLYISIIMMFIMNWPVNWVYIFFILKRNEMLK